jgi:hypothetical protein
MMPARETPDRLLNLNLTRGGVYRHITPWSLANADLAQSGAREEQTSHSGCVEGNAVASWS